MGDGKKEEDEAIRMRYCELGVWMGRRWVGGWVGGLGWVGGWMGGLTYLWVEVGKELDGLCGERKRRKRKKTSSLASSSSSS